MATANTYNGWTNYETWLVNLWMDNEEGSQAFWSEIAAEVVEQSGDDDRDDAIEQVADCIKAEHESFQEEQAVCPGVFGDLLNSAMSEVNWREIAAHLVEDLKESAT